MIELHGDETVYREIDNDQDIEFQITTIDDIYVSKLIDRFKETVYLEQDQDQLRFTESCWEIQRVNALIGGAVIIDEVVRLRNIGTGKYLALDENNSSQLTLIS